jgi:hypothetical protein
MTTLARVELASISGIPEDTVLNQFVVANHVPADGAAAHGDLCDAITDFYNLATPSGIQIGSMIGGSRSRAFGGLTVKLYDITTHLGGGSFGSPFYVFQDNLVGADGSANLPEEVAAVLTLRGQGWDTAAVEAPDGGDPGVAKDRPRQRHTGRIYLGPLKASCLVTDATTGITRLNAGGAGAFVQTVLNRTQQLQDDLQAIDPTYTLAVWSKVDGIARTVVQAEMDNAFDTQRRRGPAATARLVQSIT